MRARMNLFKPSSRGRRAERNNTRARVIYYIFLLLYYILSYTGAHVRRGRGSPHTFKKYIYNII